MPSLTKNKTLSQVWVYKRLLWLTSLKAVHQRRRVVADVERDLDASVIQLGSNVRVVAVVRDYADFGIGCDRESEIAFWIGCPRFQRDVRTGVLETDCLQFFALGAVVARRALAHVFFTVLVRLKTVALKLPNVMSKSTAKSIVLLRLRSRGIGTAKSADRARLRRAGFRRIVRCNR
jgi:hypothetical protein